MNKRERYKSYQNFLQKIFKENEDTVGSNGIPLDSNDDSYVRMFFKSIFDNAEKYVTITCQGNEKIWEDEKLQDSIEDFLKLNGTILNVILFENSSLLWQTLLSKFDNFNINLIKVEEYEKNILQFYDHIVFFTLWDDKGLRFQYEATRYASYYWINNKENVQYVKNIIKNWIKSNDNNILYKHKKTGNLYYVVNTIVKSKQINTGEWVESILYRSKIDGKFYTREKNDFYNKFIKLN